MDPTLRRILRGTWIVLRVVALFTFAAAMVLFAMVGAMTGGSRRRY